MAATQEPNGPEKEHILQHIKLKDKNKKGITIMTTECYKNICSQKNSPRHLGKQTGSQNTEQTKTPSKQNGERTEDDQHSSPGGRGSLLPEKRKEREV